MTCSLAVSKLKKKKDSNDSSVQNRLSVISFENPSKNEVLTDFKHYVIAIFLCEPRNCECTTTFPNGTTIKETHTVNAQNKAMSTQPVKAENYSGDEFIKTCKLIK